MAVAGEAIERRPCGENERRDVSYENRKCPSRRAAAYRLYAKTADMPSIS